MSAVLPDTAGSCPGQAGTTALINVGQIKSPHFRAGSPGTFPTSDFLQAAQRRKQGVRVIHGQHGPRGCPYLVELARG